MSHWLTWLARVLFIFISRACTNFPVLIVPGRNVRQRSPGGAVIKKKRLSDKNCAIRDRNTGVDRNVWAGLAVEREKFVGFERTEFTFSFPSCGRCEFTKRFFRKPSEIAETNIEIRLDPRLFSKNENLPPAVRSPEKLENLRSCFRRSRRVQHD